MRWSSVFLRRGHRTAALLIIAGWSCAGVARADAPSPADRLQSLASLLTAVDQHVPAERYDPAAAASAIDADARPEAVMQWVAKRTVLVPYRGLLHGIAGSLIDGRVNSLERARLIADLLTRRGVEARLVHATLPPASAARLLDANPPARPWEAPLEAPSDIKQAIADDPNLGADYYEEAVRKYRAASSAMAAAMKDMAAQETTALLGYGLAGSRQPDRRAAALAALADHWWVQARSDGEWQDLDPSRDQLGPAALVPAAIDTELDEALYHKVGIRLLVEFWDAGKLRTETVLDRTLRTAELGDERISLTHRPLTASPASNEVKAVIESLAGEWAWLPVLTIGSEEQKGRIFTFGGETLDADDATLTALAGGSQPAQGVGGAMGGLFGGFGDDSDGAPATLPQRPDEDAGPVKATAEWIEFTISGPGFATKVERRTIFDLIGPAARTGQPKAPALTAPHKAGRALALVDDLDLLPITAIPSAPFQIHVLCRDGASIFRMFANAIRQPDALPSPESMPSMVSLSLRAFAAERWLTQTADAGVYLDRPDIVMQRHGFRIDGDGTPSESRMIDIVDNAVGIHPLARRPAFELALAQGVADTVTEAHVLAKPTEHDENTALLFHRDLAANRHWALVAAGGGAPRSLPADQRTLIEQAASQGMALVVPAAPLPDDERIAWWRVDPLTGTTLGISRAGAGQSTAENIRLTRQALKILLCGSYAVLIVKGKGGEALKNYVFALTCVAATFIPFIVTVATINPGITLTAGDAIMVELAELVGTALAGYGTYNVIAGP